MFDTGDRVCWYQGVIGRNYSCLLVCDFVTIDALQLFKIDRYFPPIRGTFGIEDERGLGYSRHLSVD